MLDRILILLALVFFGERLAARFGQPTAMASVLVGIVMGPSVLGMVHEEEIALLAQMGAVLLLFTIGIESEVREIYNRENALIALGGVIVPFALGFLLSYLVPGVTFWEQVFIGIILVATSVGITAKLLQDMGMLQTRIASTIIGAAVVDDILGLIVLSAGIASSSVGGFSLWPIAQTVLIAVAFIFISITFLGRLVGNWLHWLEFEFGLEFREIAILPMLIIAFFFAWISETLGLSIIIGAFTAGIMLPLASEHRHEIKKHIDPIYRLLVPFFFIIFGVMVDLKASYGLLWFGLLLTVVAIVGKVIGCGLPARYLRFSDKDALAVGVGMSPRGEVGLIVALIALQHGIISEHIYSQAVFMSIATLIIAPITLKKLLEREAVF